MKANCLAVLRSWTLPNHWLSGVAKCEQLTHIGWGSWSAPSVMIVIVRLNWSPDTSLSAHQAQRSEYCAMRCCRYKRSAPKRTSMVSSLSWNLCSPSWWYQKRFYNKHSSSGKKQIQNLQKLDLVSHCCFSSWQTSHCEKELRSLNLRIKVHLRFQWRTNVPYLMHWPLMLGQLVRNHFT